MKSNELTAEEVAIIELRDKIVQSAWNGQYQDADDLLTDYRESIERESAAEIATLKAQRDELLAAAKNVIYAKSIETFRCTCEARDEDMLQALVDTTDDLWRDLEAAIANAEKDKI